MKQTVMLKKNYEFKIVLTKGRFYIGKQLKIVILKNGKNFKTLGIAVSTKNGKAFQRNKAKRLIREAYKNLEEKIINGYSIVVLLKKDIDINDMKYIDIINEMVSKTYLKIFCSKKYKMQILPNMFRIYKTSH